MSSSFPERRVPLRVSPGRVAAGLVMCALLGREALAADVYWRPDLEARVEGHTNRDLAAGEAEESMTGYMADLGVLWGRDTPRSHTVVRPRVRFQDFPKRDDLRRIEEFLDVRTGFQTLRDNFLLTGNYSRRDAYTAEFLQAGFDPGPVDPSVPVEPIDPTVSETGRLIVNTTRTLVQLRPSYTRRISERSALGGGVTLQTVEYDSDIPGTQVDFDYWLAEGTWARQLDERTELRAGPYVSRYEAKDDSSVTDGYGAYVDWSRAWNERIRATISLRAERNESDRILPTVVQESSTSWGARLNLYRKVEVSEWQVSIGRSITPTGSGSKADSDEVHVQYERALSPRLVATTAARALRVRSQSQFTRGDDLDYARAEISMTWALSRTWSVRGGYEFTWREYTLETDDANDSALFVSMRFAGLDRRQR
jgi:hypothetical protein